MTEYLQSLRKAGIVDVTAAAQFMHRGDEAESEAAIASETVDAPGPENQAAAFRLFLSHVVLEHGELWITEDEVGIQAAALWLPRDPQRFGGEINQVLSRELGLPSPTAHRNPPTNSSHPPASQPATGPDNVAVHALPDILAVADAFGPDLILADVTLGPELDPTTESGGELVRELLRPVLGSPQYSRFAAVSVDAAIVNVLEDLGFRAVATVPISESAVAWVGVADFATHVA